jgi:hypothetical protein
MKKSFQIKALMGFLVAFFAVAVAFAQAPKATPATNESVEGKIGDANIKITYGSPTLQGRTILGKMEPYGQPWRAGANAATVITTDKDITVNGQKLAAGKYSIYMVPTEKDWKVVFNSATGQWGINRNANDPRGYSANVDATKDVLATTVTPKKAGPTEKLKYEIRPNGIALVWENVDVFVPVK